MSDKRHRIDAMTTAASTALTSTLLPSPPWALMQSLDCRQLDDIARLQDQLRRGVLEPIARQQREVLPALIELEPRTEAILRDVRSRHAAVLEGCARLFAILAQCISSDGGRNGGCIHSPEGARILSELRAHIDHSSSLLTPLLSTHGQDLQGLLDADAA